MAILGKGRSPLGVRVWGGLGLELAASINASKAQFFPAAARHGPVEVSILGATGPAFNE